MLYSEFRGWLFLPNSNSLACAMEPYYNIFLATTKCVNPNLYIHLITNRNTHTQYAQTYILTWEENDS